MDFQPVSSTPEVEPRTLTDEIKNWWLTLALKKCKKCILFLVWGQLQQSSTTPSHHSRQAHTMLLYMLWLALIGRHTNFIVAFFHSTHFSIHYIHGNILGKSFSMFLHHAEHSTRKHENQLFTNDSYSLLISQAFANLVVRISVSKIKAKLYKTRNSNILILFW